MTMMKRRNIIMVMMTSLLLGSCSSEDILSVPNGNGRIRFDVGVSQSQEVAVTPMNGGATRSAEPLFLPTSSIEMHSGDMTMYANCASTADIPMHNIIPETTTRGSIQTAENFYLDFGLFGYFYDSNLSWASVSSSIPPESSMTNLLVTQNDNSWTTDVYWPGGTKRATFFAYAPYDCQGAILESNTGAPKITYTVPSEIANQRDLLVAKSDENISCDGNSTVALNFQHALTAIKFTQGDLGDYTKITGITISGVKNQGELSVDGASWDNVSTTSGNSYTITSETGITLNDVLLLMPQTLPSGAKLEVKMSNDDGTKTKNFSADLTGVWQKGYTVTYQLSVNKIFGDYVLEITPNTKDFDENGGDVSITVKSYFKYSDGSHKALPWTASYAYADGTDTRTPIANALTITSASSGNGGSTGEIITAKIGKQYFKSNNTWSAPEKGTEASPFDLSLYNPSSSTHTLTTAQSANCYVVNAPGWYKIPLYYGNSLNNTAGYGTATFQNHEGTQINNQNRNFSSSVSSGKLLWQDEYALITPTSISKTSDGQYLKFYVSPDAIAQGNAVIAALNSNDQILWSWHIWVTNMDLTKRVNVLSGENRDTNYPFMTQPVGYCKASTLSYPQRDFIVTIQQGTSCKLAAARISQKSGTTLSVAQNCTFYQWGRKDPFPGASSNDKTNSVQKPCYKADGSDFVYEKKGGNTEDGKQSMAGSILNPTTFYYSLTTNSWASQYNDWCSTTYNDNWSKISNTIVSEGDWNDDNITKTVYDPCPIGFKMPGCNAFTRFTKDGNYHYSNDGHSTCNGDAWKNLICVYNKNSYVTDKGWSFYTQADDTGEPDFWYAFGFIDCWIDRYSSTGKGCLAFAGFNGGCWTARAYSAGQGCDLYFDSGSVDARFTDPRAYGFAARPVSE